ncbi:hypothetical protein A3F05_02450 [Candidatus Saccharibacteria bacterium RIFCSPHIGHO2_12_FULL_47_17]|nr:MAG: hypothetical protein A3F05_02450 [Candidatus Saccharibacteria bacterium RIFCSPHIGHO2_12_FULL_47_17]
MFGRVWRTLRGDPRNKRLPRLSLHFFTRPKLSLAIWLVVAAFGLTSYSSLLNREGWPSVNIPFAVVNSSYLVNDPAKVDNEVAQPLSEAILKFDKTKRIQSQSFANFATIVVEYDSGTDSESTTPRLEQEIKSKLKLPEQAALKFENPKFGFTERGDDMVISFYARDNSSSALEIAGKAKEAEAFLKQQNLSLVQQLSLIDQFVRGIDLATGQEAVTQRYFDRYGVRESSQNNFYPSASIGLNAKAGADIVEYDKQVRAAVDKLNQQPQFNDNYQATISASYAPDIKSQINELQKALLEGLAAALLIGAIVIALRASLITVISMVTVIAITLGILFLIGYTLNTITLFALVLGLALIVDDTIIMIEAIDAQRRRTKEARQAVKVATSKISRAMTAATFTAILSFAPLIFVGGILGDFIRAIPVTVIIGLLTSLLVALIFIPTFAKYLLLGKKQMGEGNVVEVAAGVEARIARFIGRPLKWAKHSRRRVWGTGIAAVLIGLGFIMAGGYLFSKVTFNIFPPVKDSNGLMINMTFPDGTTIDQAGQLADRIDSVVGKTVGTEFREAAYYSSGTGQMARLRVILTPYDQRDIRAPQIVNSVQKAVETQVKEAKVKVGQEDVGPPAAAFVVQIRTDDRTKAYALAKDLADFLQKTILTRPSGEKAKITTTTVGTPEIITRADGQQYVSASAEFDGTDTSTLVTLAQNAINKEFDEKRLAQYGLGKDTLKYDLGQESENQESFKTLLIAFPALLIAIYVLLAFQFRSMLQPALIFMAIPFSLFGITLGLYLTDNAFSFFAMLGFFALLGLSIKNTILLTDYANQARAAGMGPVDAVYEALQERFRPLIATSFTAVVALTPLALTSPFWEGLMVVLIFGLLSSTFLVVTVFPYYYLAAEYLRLKISRQSFLVWLIANAGGIFILNLFVSIGLAFQVMIAFNLGRLAWRLGRRFGLRRT